MEEEILKERRLDWVDEGLFRGTSVLQEGIPSFNCWFSLVSQKISTSRSSIQRLASSTFYRSSLLLLRSSLTMLMLQISRSEMEESHPPLPFLKEGTGSSFSSTLSSIFLILEGDSAFLGDGGVLLLSIFSCRADKNSICLLALSNSSESCFTCLLSYWVAFMRGSSFTTGLLVMKEALVAQVSVEMFYSMKVSFGLMQAIMRQQLFPPIDCFRIDVSFESRQGTYTFSSFFSLGFAFQERMLMTCLRVKSDLFISMLSLASLPSVPVIESLSEPARSTNSILLVRRWEGSARSKLSILMERMEWLREDCRFSLWVALMRFFSPAWKCRSNSASLLHSKRNRFYTVNCSSLLHLSRSPQIWAGLMSSVLLLREDGLRRSQIFSLQICRNETERVQLRAGRSLATLSKSALATCGMIPLSAPIS